MDNINDIQYFVKESLFEQALVDLLPHHGWEKEVLVQPTEDDLIQNWAKILFDNNRDINKLGNYPLTASEMRQIIDQGESVRQPIRHEYVYQWRTGMYQTRQSCRYKQLRQGSISEDFRCTRNQCRTEPLPDCPPTSFQGFAPVGR